MSVPSRQQAKDEMFFDESQNISDPFSLNERSKTLQHSTAERSKSASFEAFENNQKQENLREIES